jgi:hypothetical protein
LGVSIPNQATALITCGRPSAVRIVAPSVCSQPALPVEPDAGPIRVAATSNPRAAATNRTHLTTR